MAGTHRESYAVVKLLIAALMLAATLAACGPPPKPAGLIRLERLRDQPVTRDVRTRDPSGWRESDSYYRMAHEAWQSSDMDEATDYTLLATIHYETAAANTRKVAAEERSRQATQRLEVARERLAFYQQEETKLKAQVARLTAELAGAQQRRQAAIAAAAARAEAAGRPSEEQLGAVKADIATVQGELTATEAVRANELAPAHYNKARNLLGRAHHEVGTGDLVAARATLEEARKEIAAARATATPLFDSAQAKRTATERRARLVAAGQAAAGIDVREEPRGVVLVVGALFGTDSEPTFDEQRVLALDNVGRLAGEFGDLPLLLEGHTDARGAKADREPRSLAYAQAVKAFLAQKGVAADRMAVKGYGDGVPVEQNRTKAGRAQNRRVEVVFLLGR